MRGVRGRWWRRLPEILRTNSVTVARTDVPIVNLVLQRLIHRGCLSLSLAKSIREMDRQRLVTLAFTGSIGMTLVILACALPEDKVWWPFFVVLFYVLAPMPTILARRYTEHTGSSSSSIELAIFITMGFVVSSFALPIVLSRSPDLAPVISASACYLTLAGNVIVYLTYVGFFVTLYQEDSDYSMW